MENWFEEVFFPAMLRNGNQCLLIVDQWASWRDRDTINKHIPHNFHFDMRLIPPKCTKYAQPSDRMLFRQMKDFDRRITDFVMLDDLPIDLDHRDMILKRQSLILDQFQSEIYKDYLLYSWRKCGYYGPDAQQDHQIFNHPIRYSFDSTLFPNACQIVNCENTVFIRCSWCALFLCFECFFIKYHTHNC